MNQPDFSFADEAGIAGKILVGVVAWALGAVLLLTTTLVNAQQIDNRVDRITHTVGPIDHDTDSVALAVQTNETAQKILAAAKPLSGQAEQIVQATASIDGTAKSIDTAVGQIGESVRGIDGNARSINATVVDINKTVKDINGTAKTIGATVNSIGGHVGSIGGAVHGIAASLNVVLDNVRSIRGDHTVPEGFGTGLAGINRRADAAIALVQRIKGDLGNILTAARNIEASARSIETNADKLPTP